MFIKRDERKIVQILSDPEDGRSRMLLSKRSHEFDGNLDLLCRESNVKQLKNLRELNLYENQLRSIDGIGMLAKTPLEDLNLGSNQLTTLPPDMGGLNNLKTLWLDDNHLDDFPVVLCSIKSLEELHMSGNQLNFIPQSINALKNLKTLALDNNKIEVFPMGILELAHLEHLWLRQNLLQDLPESLSDLKVLQTLSVSSNQLTSLPTTVYKMDTLKNIYANANDITWVDTELVDMPALEKLNLANNKLTSVPIAWNDKWGEYDEETGRLALEDGQQSPVVVTFKGNKLAK